MLPLGANSMGLAHPLSQNPELMHVSRSIASYPKLSLSGPSSPVWSSSVRDVMRRAESYS